MAIHYYFAIINILHMKNYVSYLDMQLVLALNILFVSEIKCFQFLEIYTEHMWGMKSFHTNKILLHLKLCMENLVS